MYWIAGKKFDSNGVARIVPLYCYQRSGVAKANVKAIERFRADPSRMRGKEGLQREMKTLEGITELRVWSPAEYADRFERAKVEYRDSVSANDGICPRCGKRKFDTGTSLGRKARRCRKCGHVWFKVRNVRKPKRSDFRYTKTEKKILEAEGRLQKGRT